MPLQRIKVVLKDKSVLWYRAKSAEAIHNLLLSLSIRDKIVTVNGKEFIPF